MYAICSTKKDDVLNCVVKMVKEDQDGPIFQFGAAKYKELERDQSKVIKSYRKVVNDTRHVINLKTKKIHKKGCRYIGKNTVDARLVNIKSTGLKTCSKCMK